MIKETAKGQCIESNKRRQESLDLGKLNDTSKVRVLQNILRILKFNPKNMGSNRITLKNSDLI